MAVERINHPDIPAPVGAYVHATRSRGMLYLSGFTAFGTPAQNGDMAAQFDAALGQIKTIVEAEGATFEDLMKVTVFVTELDDLAGIREVGPRYYGENLPASTLVQVAALIIPELKVEIEAVFSLPE